MSRVLVVMAVAVVCWQCVIVGACVRVVRGLCRAARRLVVRVPGSVLFARANGSLSQDVGAGSGPPRRTPGTTRRTRWS